MAFRYLRDPLFLICLALYLVNRLVLKRLVGGGFVHDHFNDLICIPFLVPVMLCAMRQLKLRNHDRVPDIAEVAIPLAVWSILFEIVLPLKVSLRHLVKADFRDIFYYMLGACIAVIFWDLWYRRAART